MNKEQRVIEISFLFCKRQINTYKQKIKLEYIPIHDHFNNRIPGIEESLVKIIAEIEVKQCLIAAIIEEFQRLQNLNASDRTSYSWKYMRLIKVELYNSSHEDIER